MIHAVGPVWHGGTQGEPALLAACYRRALELAVENRVTTIAFPCISTGVYGYPIEPAAAIATDTVRASVAAPSSIHEVVFCCFSELDLRIYERALGGPSP